tara:strand:- start:1807 stop:2376 length:570 start_codon:yes stop_codon:yes gene_type:complete
MFNKVTSIFLIFLLCTNSVFAQPFMLDSKTIKEDEEVESVFTFKPVIYDHAIESFKYKTVFFPVSNMPPNLSMSIIDELKSSEGFLSGLYCFSKTKYDGIISRFKVKEREIQNIIDTEREYCDNEKEEILESCRKKEDSLIEKINKVEEENKDWEKKYKSLEAKNFWIQVGAGVAVVGVSSFAIYSLKK